MQRSSILLLPAVLLVVTGCRFWLPKTAVNPDPNHTHADIAMWVEGVKIDFSGARYMTTEAEEEAAPIGSVKKYMHLHDGNEHVVHRHKPALTIGAFFQSIGFPMTKDCLTLDSYQYGTLDSAWKKDFAIKPRLCTNGKFHWIMVVNGKQMSMDPGFVFKDGDKILLLYTAGDSWQQQWMAMTDDACRYSKTCPQRGPAPTESCIADPEVPCKEVK